MINKCCGTCMNGEETYCDDLVLCKLDDEIRNYKYWLCNRWIYKYEDEKE